MDTIDIQYRFYFNDGNSCTFDLHLDTETLEMVLPVGQHHPDWARLESHQCSHCPLSADEHENCPVATNLVPVVDTFNKVLSYEELEVEVVTEERVVRQKSTAQKAISSLMGLLIGTSACPHTGFFKPMARNHLPLASQDETIYRAASTYLLAQYFLHHDQAEFDFSGLDKIYQNVRLINKFIAQRLRSATEADSTVNAIVILDLNAQIMPMAIEESLEDVRSQFEPYVVAQR